jgi:trehalose utilization protein
MKTTEFTIDFAKRFKKNYSYKMGGKQTIVMPNGDRFDFDDREYYSGTGSKYNSSIKHDDLGDILVTSKELKEVKKQEKDRAKAIQVRVKEAKEKAKRIAIAKRAEIYNIEKKEYGTFIELSDEEVYGRYFDVARLSKTLKISIQDADLLNSQGKTYVFAKSEDGNVYELYHSSLDCNYLSISVEVTTHERIAEFSPIEWQSAPYASLVGQTTKSNHFVC